MIDKNTFKNHFSLVKAIVVSTEDPDSLGRIQVWIPSYHQALREYRSKGNMYDGLPWAQVCAPLLGTESTSFIKSLLSSDSPVAALPDVNDVVWIGFEGGDIRYPIYLGTLCAGSDVVSSTSDPSMLRGGTLSSVILDAYIDSGITTFSSTDINSNGSYDKFGLFLWSDTDLSNIIMELNTDNKIATRMYLGSMYQWTINEASRGFTDFAVNKANALKISTLLGSDEGKSAQKKYAQNQLSQYLSDAVTVGIQGTSNRAFYALLSTTFTKEELSSLDGLLSTSYSIDDVHRVLLTYKWSSRQYEIIEALYQTIKVYEENGRLMTEIATPGASTIIDLVESPYDKSLRSADFTLNWVVPSCTNITQRFGPTNYDPNHRGIDISQWDIHGQPVVAPCSGVVSVVQNAYDSPYALDWSYGNCIDLKLTDSDTLPANQLSAGVALRYAHLSKIDVVANQSVTKGQVLGYIGNTGNSSGAHLHLELLLNYNSDKWNGIVNPVYYFRTEFTGDV